MKFKTLMISTLFCFSIGASSFAKDVQFTKEYDRDALSLLTEVFTYCPIEFIQAMKGASNVASATYTYLGAEDGTHLHYIIKTVDKSPFPSDYEEPIATLHIRRDSIKSTDEDLDSSDGPSSEWKTTCTIETP